jgi:hypothetical protein
MSVWTTPAGTATVTDVPVRHLDSPVDPVDPVDPAPVPSAEQGRRELRAARRQRRRLAALCAAFVAVCLALTLLVVTLARDRAPSPQGAPAAAVSGSGR